MHPRAKTISSRFLKSSNRSSDSFPLMSELNKLTIAEAQAKLSRREISSREI